MKNTETVIRGTTLPDQVYELLARKITSGEFGEGDRLPPETHLARDFGVSRTVLREAIARLRNAGLVVTKQGLGMFVTGSFEGIPFRISAETRNDVINLFELRIGLESEAAALAAKRRTNDHLKALILAIEAMQQAIQLGADGVQEDFQFHRALADATNNAMYKDFLAFLEPHIYQQLLISHQNTQASGHPDEVIGEHRAIYEAVLAQDSDAARAATLRHLKNGLKRLAC